MICPACHTEIELSWKRYWSSPFGRHVCDRCAARFRLAHTPGYYAALAVLWLLILVPLYGLAKILGLDSPLAGFASWIVGICIMLPIDRLIDNHRRRSVLLQAERE